MNIEFFATSNRDPLSYSVGEPILFSFTTTNAPANAHIEWSLTSDDGQSSSGTLALDDSLPPFAFKPSSFSNGFLHLHARLVTQDGSELAQFDGGAGVNVDDIRPDTPMPADFNAFWSQRKAALASIPFTDTACREILSPLQDVRLFEVTIPCAGGRPSTGFLSIPNRPGRFPARLHFHGYNESWDKSAYATPTADRLSKDDIIFDISAHGFELNRLPEYYTALRAESGSNGYDYAFDPMQNSNPETAYFGGMVWRVLRAIEYLKTRPEWNRQSLIAEGGSCGGLQAIWAAALDHDVTECRPFIPWCCNLAGPSVGRIHGDWFIEWMPALAYYDTVNMAQNIPTSCRTTITWAGLGDYICPPSGVMAFYNSLHCPKKITFVQGATHLFCPSEQYQTAHRSTL